MDHVLQQIADLSLKAKLFYAIVGTLFIHGAFHLLERSLPRHFGYVDVRYRVRKLITAAGYIVIAALVVLLFADRLKQVGLALGLFGAGVIVALQEVIASIGGFFAIGFSHLYRVGDRIQVNDTNGDVVDISVLRTTVIETGNWVSGDLYNGRLVHVPNSAVLKSQVFNYSQGFRFIWDEVKIKLSSRSDHQQARLMLLRVAKETISDYLVEAQGSWKHIIENYRIENDLLEPTVALEASTGSLEFSVSYIVDYKKRSALRDRLFTKIVDEVGNSNGQLEWASSSTTGAPQSALDDLRRGMTGA